MVGIIVAIEEELDEIKNIMQIARNEKKHNIEFCIGTIENKECVLALCEAGKVNAARCSQVMIDEYNPTEIINSGVAGGLSEKVKIGDIVIGEKLAQYDMDLTAFGRKIGVLPGKLREALGRYIPSDKELVAKAERVLKEDDSINGVIGTIATGDKFVTDTSFSKWIKEEFEADACEMEGAAIAQVCYQNEVPFVVIRSISDAPNDSNHVDYETFVKTASKIVAKFVKSLLKIDN